MNEQVQNTTGDENNIIKNRKKTPFWLSAVFFLLPVIGLIVPFLLFKKDFSPVLNDNTLGELTFVKYLVDHNSHYFADGFTTTRSFFFFSTRYFLTYYYEGFATWKDALFNAVSSVYGIFALSYLFFVTSFHARKIYTYIALTVPAVLLSYFGLTDAANFGNFLPIVSAALVCLGLFIHGLRFKFPVPARLAISALCLVPATLLIFNLQNYKNRYSFDNSNLLTIRTEKPVPSEDLTGKYTGLVNFLSSADIPLSYCTDYIINEVSLISDGTQRVAPVKSLDDLTPVTRLTDTYENPFDEVLTDTKPFYMIMDAGTVSENSGSPALAFGECIYADDYYSVYSYKNIDYFNDEIFQNNISKIEHEHFDSFYYSFCGSYISDPKDFPVFSGTKPLFIRPSTKDCDNINVMLDTAIAQTGIKNVFFEIDPVYFSSKDGYEEFDHINKMIEKYPNVTFYVIMAYPGIDYWYSMDVNTRKTQISTYETVTNTLYHNDNVILFAPGCEKWLIQCKDNYVDGVPAESVAYSLLVSCVCNKSYLLTKDTAAEYVKRLADRLDEEVITHDLSEYEMVFFGDSIIGNYHGPLSIPGMCESLSDCDAYNLAVGGSSAMDNFGNFVDCFLGTKDLSLVDNEDFRSEVERFRQNHDAFKKMIFVINYGVNDYFNGVPAFHASDEPFEGSSYDSYESAYRASINKLQAFYPDAEILIIAPIYTDYFEGGTQIKSAVGSPLETYREVGRTISEDLGLKWLDSNNRVDINASNHIFYLIDGVHPNNNGLFVISNSIIDYLTEKPSEE
ncbi:MAG: hypothetical protein K5776_02500 [Lachnospiraceae bacterium]|nr:hypothetical protein [Lachnospiraceae bacterium]